MCGWVWREGGKEGGRAILNRLREMVLATVQVVCGWVWSVGGRAMLSRLREMVLAAVQEVCGWVGV